MEPFSSDRSRAGLLGNQFVAGRNREKLFHMLRKGGGGSFSIGPEGGHVNRGSIMLDQPASCRAVGL